MSTQTVSRPGSRAHTWDIELPFVSIPGHEAIILIPAQPSISLCLPRAFRVAPHDFAGNFRDLYRRDMADRHEAGFATLRPAPRKLKSLKRREISSSRQREVTMDILFQQCRQRSSVYLEGNVYEVHNVLRGTQ